MRNRRRAQRHRRRQHRGRRTARPHHDLADQRRRRRGRALVAAAVAIEGRTRGQQVVLRRHKHGVEVDARRRDALLGVRQDVEAQDRDREEGHWRRRRELHRQSRPQQALGALEMGRQREIGEPGRDGLRFVARRNAVEVAVRQRGVVEEVRLLEVGEAHVCHAAALVADAQRAAVTELDQRRGVDELAFRLRVQDFVIGADVGRVEWVGEGLESKTEVGVDGVDLLQRAIGEVGPRVFDVELSGLVVVVILGAGLHAERESRRRRTERRGAAHARLVRAVEAVEAVNQLLGRREHRFVGDDVDGAGERIGAVHHRARAADDLHALDRVWRDQAHFRTGAVGRLAGGVQAFAVHQHQQARRIEATQARTHAKRAVAHRRHVGGRRQRVTR